MIKAVFKVGNKKVPNIIKISKNEEIKIKLKACILQTNRNFIV
jgi:hypothetical protein